MNRVISGRRSPRRSCGTSLVLALAGTLLASAAIAQTASAVPVRPPGEATAVDTARARLEREKLAGEIERLHIENRNSRRSAGNFLYGNASLLAAIILGFTGLVRYLQERREELRKREDERFEQVVEALGGEREHERVGAAVLLPTFLRPGYERFFTQVFNLAAGNLRALSPIEPVGSDALVAQRAEARTNFATHALRQALATVFQDSYPLARTSLKRGSHEPQHSLSRRYLNAEGIDLDGVFLAGADFRGAWFRSGSFRGADLTAANLADIVLEKGNLSEANVEQASLCGSNLINANLSGAKLTSADLSGARADRANFSGAAMEEITMIGGTVAGANFFNANLARATFRDVDFGSLPDGDQYTNVEEAANFDGATFIGMIGLTERQIEICTARGASFDDWMPQMQMSAPGTGISVDFPIMDSASSAPPVRREAASLPSDPVESRSRGLGLPIMDPTSSAPSARGEAASPPSDSVRSRSRGMEI
jgi:uncharacterized protein YjbI with pentapeptide repeats